MPSKRFQAEVSDLGKDSVHSSTNTAELQPVQEDLAEEGKKLMTLKLGLGNVAAEHVTEPFVEALKAWPGVYKLLKKRNRKHDMQKWLRTRLADFLVFGVLIIFSIACFFLRSEIENYLLRFGVENALVAGIPNETSTGIFLEMEDVSTVGAAEQYLRGCFDYQLFNPQSTLRKFYTPVGDIRFRVQKAALRTCTRPEIPASFARSCRYVEVSSSTQDEKELLFDDDTLPELAQLLMNVSGNPTTFRKSTVATDEIWGKNGALYSGSGYSFWFPINPSNLANLTTKMGELDWLWPQWLTGDTRMLAVEFTLANYHAGGYVSTVLLLEIFPSGASRFTAVLLPFHLAKTSGDITADVLDIFRWIIIIGYLCLYKVWRTCEDYVRDGFSGLRYVLSPAGLLDAASIGLFIALQYWRSSKVKPVEPMSSSNSQHFVSYSRWASWEEMAAIGEAVLVFLLIVRYTTLLRFYPPVYRFFVLFSKSFRVGLYYLAIFVPVAASTIFFANCLYGPYVEAYSTWVKSLMSFVSVLQNVVDIDALYEASPVWTLFYVTYCYLVLFCFFVNGFLAITAYAYFEVELTEHSDPKYERWSPSSCFEISDMFAKYCLKHTFSAANWPRVSAMATFPVTLRAALSGQTLAEVEVYADDTLQALRAAVHSQEGGCMVRCDFLFGGKVLVEHELLGDAGVQPGGVVDVLRSPGPWLAAACADGAARLWDLSSGDCFKTLHGHGAGLRKVVLLADQQHVLTGSDDGTAILWNLGGAGHRTLADHGACVTEVSASPDSKLVLTIAHGELRVFRTGSGECIWALDDEYILHACFAPNSAEVLVASSTQLRLWCLKELRESARLQGHGAAVLAATYSRNGSMILSASIDRTARVWDASSGACLHILSGHLDSVRALSISASGELLATASGITARVWSSVTGACERAISSHPGTIYALQFSADARILLVAFGCGREVFAGPANSALAAKGRCRSLSCSTRVCAWT
eukprot:s5732_g5.t1